MTIKSTTIFDSNSDLVILVLKAPTDEKNPTNVPKLIPPAWAAQIISFIHKTDFKSKSGKFLSFDLTPLQRLIVGFSDATANKFSDLTLCRKILETASATQPKTIAFFAEIRMTGFCDSFASAWHAQNFQFEKYTATKKPVKKPAEITLIGEKKTHSELVEIFESAIAVTEGTNLVRQLGMRAGNDLDCKNYVAFAKDFAKSHNFAYEFLDISKLSKIRAGAFLAVAQGSSHQDAGIVKITYVPKSKKSAKVISLVGKGVVFDTGGTNLKPAGSMYGMHGDMAGSAIVLALLQLAAHENWPCQVEGWLAISDNAIGPNSYRQNDVVTALNGKTIEIIHTDAEGRMMLADALTLASKSKPDLILDFATLTGACVGAISSTYAGVFSNRMEFNAVALELGQQCGERVWPFPMDEDFSECLESEVADLKQCRLKDGVDHIEAALFLKNFLSFDVPWMHVDVSCAENDGGLAHVSTKSTGFGVRFAAAFIRRFLKEK